MLPALGSLARGAVVGEPGLPPVRAAAVEALDRLERAVVALHGWLGLAAALTALGRPAMTEMAPADWGRRESPIP